MEEIQIPAKHHHKSKNTDFSPRRSKHGTQDNSSNGAWLCDRVLAPKAEVQIQEGAGHKQGLVTIRKLKKN